jgi:hypothetical protein
VPQNPLPPAGDPAWVDRAIDAVHTFDPDLSRVGVAHLLSMWRYADQLTRDQALRVVEHFAAVATGELVEQVTAESVEHVEQVELADGNPVIAELVAALRTLGATGPAAARDLLDVAPASLTDRERLAVLGWLGETRRTCSRCGELVLFVTDQPDPGWWSHDLVPEQPHAAEPVVAR